MNANVFFDAERQKFFRPLNSSRRELVAACLRTLFERLHGPTADYAHNLNREMLKELILPIVRDYQNKLDSDITDDELDISGIFDPQQLTTTLIRILLRDGWLEQYPDRHGLITVFRFSRPGKLFAEAFWALDRPSRSRQRNMRGCRNALDAVLSERGDAHDLVDAYEYAEKVIEDLTDGIDDLQERIRYLMQEATTHSQWDDFVDFLTRFRRDYSKQLTADSATLNRQAIRQKTEAVRFSISAPKIARIENQLHDIAQWAVKEYSGPSIFEWLLGRIEDIVNAACETKQPTFVKTMDTYLRRVTGLVQQSLMLRTGQKQHSYLHVIAKLAEQDRQEQEQLLHTIGQQISAVEVRLLDPSNFRLRSATQRRKAATISVKPRASREARLESFLKRAESEAFTLSNEHLANTIRLQLRQTNLPLRLSSLAPDTARDLLGSMQSVEAIRNTKGADLIAIRLDTRIENDYYSGYDYEFDFKKSA